MYLFLCLYEVIMNEHTRKMQANGPEKTACVKQVTRLLFLNCTLQIIQFSHFIHSSEGEGSDPRGTNTVPTEFVLLRP